MFGPICMKITNVGDGRKNNNRGDGGKKPGAHLIEHSIYL